MAQVTTRTTSARWLVRRARRPDAPVNLYCFPHAGGSPGEYVRWCDELPGVQVWGVQLPGRGARMAEPPFTRMRPLVDAIVDAVEFDRPFALFGHSLGSLVAFEVARTLRDRGRELPERLFVSSAPQLCRTRRPDPIHALPDDELLAEIERRWGGLPLAARENPEFRALAVGHYRADLAVFETYQHVSGAPLDCPITALSGDQELVAPTVEGWRAWTATGFDHHVLPGGHFYLRSQRRELLRLIDAALATGISR